MDLVEGGKGICRRELIRWDKRGITKDGNASDFIATMLNLVFVVRVVDVMLLDKVMKFSVCHCHKMMACAAQLECLRFVT